MSDDDWVKAASADDYLVAEMLMGLSRAEQPKRERLLALPLEWTVRQPRSRPAILLKKKPVPRASPTTPLSWSGGTSASGGGGGGADGSEESSRPLRKKPVAAGSKVSEASGTGTTGTATRKRQRKKKTLAELREEEDFLLRERKHLKRELATLRENLDKQKAKNEALKKAQLDLELQRAVEGVSAVASFEEVPNQTQEKVTPRDPISSTFQAVPGVENHVPKKQPALNLSSKAAMVVMGQDINFVVPDLNLPMED